MKSRLAGAMIVALIAALALPAVGVAQQVSPTERQYGNVLTQTGGGLNEPSQQQPDTGLGGRVGPLPFTGFDVIAMAAVALAVTGLGLALQRAVSRDPGDQVT